MGIKGIGKEGRLYIKFLAAAALLFTLAFSLYALAANPSASPATVTNANYTNSNVSSAFANNVIFGYWKLDGNANDSFGCRSKIVNERVRTK